MAEVRIPENIRFIMDKLKEAGHAANVVGGCIRDSLLNHEVKDWDLTTSAKPDEIKEVFKDYTIINNNGEKHGTVTVRYNDENIEITTYRLDSDYTDHRHPDKVEFTDNLKEDLARRDFTINAMAYSGSLFIYDPFNGQDDLKNNIIRAVGNPADRFEEDALRILRGIRFAARYQFVFDNDTLSAMYEKRDLLKHISKERILAELKEIFSYKYTGILMQGLLVRSIICDIIPEFDFINPNIFLLMTDNFMTNFSALLGYADKFAGLEDTPATVIDRLGFSNEDAKAIKVYSTYSFINLNGFTQDYSIVYMARTLIDDYHYSREDAFAILVKILEIQSNFLTVPFAAENGYFTKAYDLIVKVFEKDHFCLCLKDMKINGNDLVALGFKGPRIREELNYILDSIIEGEVTNDSESLLEWAACDC